MKLRALGHKYGDVFLDESTSREARHSQARTQQIPQRRGVRIHHCIHDEVN
jgi:hypothetical protein